MNNVATRMPYTGLIKKIKTNYSTHLDLENLAEFPSISYQTNAAEI